MSGLSSFESDPSSGRIFGRLLFIKYGTRLVSEEGWMLEIPKMKKAGCPELTTVGELAGYLRMGSTELEWFSDLKNLNGVGPLGHDRYRWIPKCRGGIAAVQMLDAARGAKLLRLFEQAEWRTK